MSTENECACRRLHEKARSAVQRKRRLAQLLLGNGSRSHEPLPLAQRRSTRTPAFVVALVFREKSQEKRRTSSSCTTTRPRAQYALVRLRPEGQNQRAAQRRRKRTHEQYSANPLHLYREHTPNRKKPRVPCSPKLTCHSSSPSLSASSFLSVRHAAQLASQRGALNDLNRLWTLGRLPMLSAVQAIEGDRTAAIAARAIS
jgi:hypothetical protein